MQLSCHYQHQKRTEDTDTIFCVCETTTLNINVGFPSYPCNWTVNLLGMTPMGYEHSQHYQCIQAIPIDHTTLPHVLPLPQFLEDEVHQPELSIERKTKVMSKTMTLFLTDATAFFQNIKSTASTKYLNARTSVMKFSIAKKGR